MSLVTVQHKSSGQTQQIDPSAVPFFTGPGNDYELTEQAQTELPARSASKADWVTYASGPGGLPQDEAEAMTRDGLADHFSPARGEDSTEGRI